MILTVKKPHVDAQHAELHVNLMLLVKAKVKLMTNSRHYVELFEPKFSAKLLTHLRKQAKKTAVGYKKTAVNKSELPDLIKAADVELNVEVGAAMLESIEASLSDVFFASAEEAATAMGLEVSADILLADAIAYAKSESAVLVAEITKTTENTLREIIAKSIKNGETVQETAIRIMTSTAFDANRADMIARTEIVNAHTAGNILVWKRSGLVDEIEWITAHDELTCDVCASNNAKVVKIGKQFPSGAFRPAAHPRCRCDIMPVIKKID